MPAVATGIATTPVATINSFHRPATGGEPSSLSWQHPHSLLLRPFRRLADPARIRRLSFPAPVHPSFYSFPVRKTLYIKTAHAPWWRRATQVSTIPDTSLPALATGYDIMSAEVSSAGPPPSAGEPSSRSHRGRGGRGRGGQRRGGNQARDRQREQPSAGQNGGESAASDRGPVSSVSNGRPGRGRRGARNPRRGGVDPGSQRTNPGTGRSFGGHLTTDAESQADAATAAAAPEFVPGRAVAGKKGKQPPPAPKAAVARTESKSTASDLATRIHEDISNGQYECVICTNEVLRNSRVWSCSICWTVAHMSCVRKWYSNQMKKSDQPEGLAPKGWRCPGCNSAMTEEPTSYHCWCGKELNPQSIPGLPPHSCNQTCAKPRPTCPHPCGLVCHAGPCPPCQLMGPSISCYCGKNVSTKRCAETDYAHGFSCGEICGDLLPCGEHECQQPCHS